ncbi:MAG TPA: cysteine--tRNA ligase [Clostridia bacterium]|nr:cysteine--tRNA ligase [Clostridia bacterium]
MTVRLFNTLTGVKEEFVPLRDDRVTMYVCGPTVYDHPHIGNWRCFVVFDTVRKYLKYRGFDVIYVQNFTDVDDKVIRKAHETGQSPKDVAKKYIAEYLREATILDIERADVHPRATLHIDDMIELVQRLLAGGHAYESAGSLYFDTTSFPEYGKLSKQKIEDLQAGARVEPDENKRHPLDFVIWKGHKPGEPAWESPWGPGRPGWHLECSAMAMKYLGATLDIHAGGSDLIFPHHENEIAQSESATGQKFARYWMHNAFLNIGGERMGKSLGNFYTLGELLEKYPPDAIRFFLLSAHYRKPLEFSEKALNAAARGMSRLKAVAGRLQRMRLAVPVDAPSRGGRDTQGVRGARRTEGDGGKGADRGEEEWLQRIASSRRDFEAYMDDDFNTADAFAVLFDLAREINARFPDSPSDALLDAAIAFYKDAGYVLGVLREFRGIPAPFSPGIGTKVQDGEVGRHADMTKIVGGLISLIVGIRDQARKSKDYQTADRIRERLTDMEIVLEDTPEGTRWRFKGQ